MRLIRCACFFVFSANAWCDQPVAVVRTGLSRQPSSSSSISGVELDSCDAMLSNRMYNRICNQPTDCCKARFGVSIYGARAEKVADLQSRRTQLVQHFPYVDPSEDSYFFRPYSHSDVERQRRIGRNPNNPYDNRFFQAIYEQFETEAK